MSHIAKMKRIIRKILIRHQLEKKHRLFLARNMNSGKIHLSENDFLRLHTALREQRRQGKLKRTKLLIIYKLIGKMLLLPLRLVPYDMVTMNSQFILRSKSGKAFEVQLVYPDDADRKKNAIAITSWLGMCLIGKREGEMVRNRFSVGRILYQPEESQDYHL